MKFFAKIWIRGAQKFQMAISLQRDYNAERYQYAEVCVITVSDESRRWAEPSAENVRSMSNVEVV